MFRNALLMLFACVFFACESGGGAEGGTSAPKTPTADQGTIVLDGGGQGNDTAPDTTPDPEDSTVNPPAEDQFVVTLKLKFPRVFPHDTGNGLRYYRVYFEPIDTNQWKEGCRQKAVGWFKFTDKETGEYTNAFGPPCVNPDASLYWCETGGTSMKCLDGFSVAGSILLGMCAKPGGQTIAVPCARSEDCGTGYCNFGEEVSLSLILADDEGDIYFQNTLHSVPEK